MSSTVIQALEKQEIIDKLTMAGYGKLVEVLLSGDNKVYTKKGRLNKSGTCRTMNWKSKQLEDALAQCREILNNEYGD